MSDGLQRTSGFPTVQHLVEALALCVVAPGLVAGLLTLDIISPIWVSGVALLHALILGLPFLVLTKRVKWPVVLKSVIIGALISMVPLPAFLAVGLGVPIGWLLAGIVGTFGAIGAACGLVFGGWIWWRERDSSIGS